MTNTELWKAAFAETEVVMAKTERYETREAFYAANRLNEVLHEIFLRGEQLRVMGAEFEPTPARGFGQS